MCVMCKQIKISEGKYIDEKTLDRIVISILWGEKIIEEDGTSHKDRLDNLTHEDLLKYYQQYL